MRRVKVDVPRKREKMAALPSSRRFDSVWVVRCIAVNFPSSMAFVHWPVTCYHFDVDHLSQKLQSDLRRRRQCVLEPTERTSHDIPTCSTAKKRKIYNDEIL